jgi:hypothetical protein
LRKHTASARLALLVPWMNGDSADQPPPAALRRQLGEFLHGFDGSAAAGYVEVRRQRRTLPTFLRKKLTRDAADWEQVRTNLLLALQQGFDGTQLGLLPLPSLRFAVRSTQRKAPGKLSRASNGERRAYRAPGAYVLQVDGTIADLVTYLVLHLLTGPDVTIGRCPAPAPYTKDTRCNRFVVTTGQGRPRVFCSEACRVRNHAEQLQQEQQYKLRRKR